MRGWVALIAGIAVSGFLLGQAAADVQKGARAGTTGSPSTTPDATTSSDDPVESMSVEGWDGGAYYDDVSNEYYCELSDEYGDGVTIWVGWDSDGFYMTIEDPNTFKVEAYTDVSATIVIDDFYKHDFKAFALDAASLDFSFGGDRETIEAIRKGEKMTLYPWDHWYTLYGLGKAVKALEDCYHRHA